MRAFDVIAVILCICCGIVLAVNDGSLYLDPDEQTFLDSHNFARSGWYAQPLNWSTTLTTKAQTWASGCLFEHTNGQLGPYGENIAAGTGNFTASNAMKMFMDGQDTFNYTNPTFSDFTQIVWQSTTEIGCSSANCSGIFDSGFGVAIMHVCFYEPVGNVVGTLLDNVGIH